MRRINIEEKFAKFSEAWSPRIIGELNGQHVKLARLRGEFEWHRHDEEDELFLVIDGRLEMHLRDAVLELGPGELLIVPKGVDHKPVAPRETKVLLFEPVSTRNTGNVESERTVKTPEWI